MAKGKDLNVHYTDGTFWKSEYPLPELLKIEKPLEIFLKP